MKTLWTRNFTIITIGSIVSLFGSAIANFALGLVIYDHTGSPFLFALFNTAFLIPGMIVPLLAGPFIDRFSRRKIIYTIDFIFFILFACLSIIGYFDYFNYILYLCGAFLLGSLSAVYQVAYESFYPMLISEGNFSKAYSISSIVYPLSNSIMVPIGAVLYASVGIFPILLLNAFSFLIAAICETQIHITESQVRKDDTNFIQEFKAGLSYLKEERGLLAIALYFGVSGLAFGISFSLLLPYFENSAHLGAQRYSFVMSIQTIGRVIGGIVHYKIVYPKHLRYTITIFVYIAVSALEVLFILSAFEWMLVFYFLFGLLGVTSYTIRVSATQSYVPNEKRGRFNAIFSVLSMCGMVFGSLIGGILGEFVYIPYIIIGAQVINFVTIYIFHKSKKEVELVYNREV